MLSRLGVPTEGVTVELAATSGHPKIARLRVMAKIMVWEERLAGKCPVLVLLLLQCVALENSGQRQAQGLEYIQAI